MNDFILILQMKQGNDQTFDKFVRKYYTADSDIFDMNVFENSVAPMFVAT